MNAMVTETLSGLDRALASGLLPEKVEEVGRKLRTRLSAPVRVTVMGLPDTGKSRVVDLLAGAPIVAEGVRLPALRLTWGETARTRIKRADGSSEEAEGLDAAWAAERRAILVEMEAPLPALKKITIMEIGIGLGRTEQARACAWAARQSELVIWCTRDFGAPEQAAWATMPDGIRDQAILLRPKIDLSPNPAAALDRAHRLAQDDFDRVLAIDTLRALSARAGATVDKPEFKASGGQPLIAAVLKLVDRTKQGHLDRADLLLAKHPEAIAAVPPLADATPVPAPDAPNPEAKPAAPEAKTGPTISDSGREVLSSVVTRLRTAGSELAEGEIDRDAVLERSVAEIVHLEERLLDAQDEDTTLMGAHDDALEALDLVQLMQIEDDPQAAEDAVVLMLQLRRRFDQLAA